VVTRVSRGRNSCVPRFGTGGRGMLLGYSPDLCCQGPECSGATSCRACRPHPCRRNRHLKEPAPKWVRLNKAEAGPPLVNGRPMTRPEHPHRYRISDEERDEASTVSVPRWRKVDCPWTNTKHVSRRPCTRSPTPTSCHSSRIFPRSC